MLDVSLGRPEPCWVSLCVWCVWCMCGVCILRDLFIRICMFTWNGKTFCLLVVIFISFCIRNLFALQFLFVWLLIFIDQHYYTDIYETFLDTFSWPSVHPVSSAESSILMCKTTFRTFLKLVSEGLVFFCCPPEKISCEVQFSTEERET